MVHRLRGLLAKRAKAAIWPTSLLKAVGGPNSIFDDKSTGKNYFGRGPKLPNRSTRGRGRYTKELGVVSRFGRVLSIFGERPNNIIGDLILKDHIRVGKKVNQPFKAILGEVWRSNPHASC